MAPDAKVEKLSLVTCSFMASSKFWNVSEQAVVILALYGCWRTQSVFLQHGQPGHTGLQWDHPDFLDGRNEPRSAPWHSAQRGWEVSASCFRGAVAPGCAVSEGSPISLSYQICWSLTVSAVQCIQVVVRGGFFMDITGKSGIYFEMG